MKREPTADDVKRAWSRFRGPHNFRERPRLYLPLNEPMRSVDIVLNDGPAAPEAIRHCVIEYERGGVNGRRAERLVGSVPGTDIRVVLETRITD